jgi:glutamate dehydrogenase
MSSKEIQKLEFISNILSEDDKKNLVLKEFVSSFFQHVSFGYLENLCEQASQNILADIAKKAFDILRKSPPKNEFHIKHILLEKHKLQVLFLHSFDKSFVVRSTKVWLATNKLVVDELVHPIFSPQRSDSGLTCCHEGSTAESLIAVILPIDIEIPANYRESLRELYSKLTLVVDDFSVMQKWTQNISSAMLAQKEEYIEQAGAFLNWLDNEHFVFLGLRHYKTINSSDKDTKFDNQATHRYGLFKEDEIHNSEDFFLPTIELQEPASQLLQHHLMHIKKEHARSIIYRGSRIDSIKVLDINQNGTIEGVVQIIGLFTSDFYKTSPIDVPWLKNKAIKVYQTFGFSLKSHDERLLSNIIDSIPLDEFYYLSEKQLVELIERILNMYDRNAVFARTDEVGRSLSVLVYLPKHKYSESLRVELGKLISKEYGGILASTHGYVGDTSFARLTYILGFNSSEKIIVNIEDLEEKLWIASQTWQERFSYFCKKKYITASITFSDLYLKLNSPEIAAHDAQVLIDWLDTNEAIYFETITNNGTGTIRVLQKDTPLTLGQIIPIFTNFQLNIQAERTFFAEINGQKIWMHYYEISNLNDLELPASTLQKLVEGLKQAWAELIEVDPFNALTVSCDLDFKEIIILRAYGRFLKQLGLNYSQKALADCLVAYPSITQLLVKYFYQMFSLGISNEKRLLELENLKVKIFQSFSVIKRLDHDRIMRRFQNVIQATLRTTAFQTGCAPHCVSFKADSTMIIEIPKPSPLVEIFVYSPTVEGCHLRGGKIARGGIRWSDRPEDFRSEVLGLMKAQMVKNSVIVPVGSKGGFVVKNYNALQESGCSDQTLKTIVVNSYKLFIEQLLSLTDNLVENQIRPPQQVIRYDDDDQYLVVAADKGTATFSDIANEISNKVSFWLGDAFASGGSNGYDHKKLGITARGAWIAVRRHFWELGIDCQNTPISVVGVGDMAGDVFGNGMLQSQKICLMAAFNHKHIFLDPTPNPEISYGERQRLFSSLGAWENYDLSKISKGGGVYDRSAKIIEITPEVANVFNIDVPELSPDELVSKILQTQVDLLFFGGIGTFIKSQIESHTAVADRANDSVRVDARIIKAKIIGEGANLGLTQLGRIEYALNGGRINTDAIDNSAGVDCSDHEVNLKIMCQVLLQKKAIHNNQRDELLASLANEVSELVLYDNWMQTLALTRMQQESMTDINAYSILIKKLETSANLPLRREVENIPSDEELQQRKNQHLGITRPELAVLLAYSKIHLYQDMLHALQYTACFGEKYYIEYFPKRFQTEYKDYLKHHPLKVEITATVLANLVINTMGPCFVGQMSEAFRVDSLEVVRAFVEVLEQTSFHEQLQNYKIFNHDKEETLDALRRLTQNLAQCVMVRLSSPQHIFAAQIKSSQPTKIPFSVLFTYQVSHRGEIDIQNIDSVYQKLNLSYLWEWAETISPTTSWQTASWLLLQHDLIQVIANLCQQAWNNEKLAIYNELYDQLKKHIASAADSSQYLLLLDYVIRQLRSM